MSQPPNFPPVQPPPGRLTRAGIALAYALFAALWIIVSGYLVATGVDNPALQAPIEIAKGLLFVAVTSVLLYLLLGRLGLGGDSGAALASPSARRPLLAAGLVFLIAAVVSGLMVRQSEQQREQQRRARITDMAHDHALVIQRSIEHALSATYALAALVRQGNGKVANFEGTAQEMLLFYPGAAALQLAPGGVVRQAVPLKGNEKAIGHDLLADPKRNKEAFLARETGRLTLAGPFTLVQGGLGAVGRLPVFLGESPRVFWGFTTVLIRFPEVLEDARLSQLPQLGFAYELWRLHPDSGERQTISIAGASALSDPVHRTLDLPNGTWTLSVEPLGGWADPYGLAFKIALGLSFSLLLAYMTKLLVDLRRYKEDLESRVEQRTRQLSTSELRFRNMSDAAGAYLWEINTDMVYTYVSGPSANVKGYPPEALLGHTPMEFMPAEDIPPVGEIVNRAISEKSSFRLQHRDITPAGEVWWEEVYGSVFCDENGRVIGLRGTGMSINARKLAEEELRRSEQRFRDVAEVSGDWIWETDADGRYTYVSDGVKAMLGYTAEEVIGKTPFDFMGPDEAQAVGAAFAGIAAARAPFSDLENVVIDREGRLHATLTSGTPILDAGGALLGYRGIDRDISVRRAAEDRIKRLTNLYNALSECNQAIVRCNSAAELFPQICRDVVRFGGMKMAWIGMLNAATGQVVPVASFGATTGYLDGVVVTSNADDPHGRGPVGTAIRENRPVWNQDYLNDPATAPWHERAARHGWRAVAALPLHRNGAVVGSFNLYADQAGAFDEDARKLLDEMATDVSYALDGFERDASIRLAAEVFEQGKEGIMITDTRGRIVRVNRAFSEISGYGEADALGQTAGLLSSGRHGKEFYRAMWDAIDASGHWQGEIWNRRKDGNIYPEWLAISRVLDDNGQPSHYVGIFSDISAHKEAEARIQRLAHFDALTGLPNRALLQDRARHALGMAQRSGEQVAVLFVDLDHFKNINDTLGHRIGDELLVEVGRRMGDMVRNEDTVSRQGGDEFVVVLLGVDADDAAHISQKLIEAVAVTFRVEQYELVVTPSIGIAMYPSDGEDFEALCKSADTAMYRAKQDGRNTFRFFTPQMQEHSVRKMQLEGSLRNALSRGELQLHYQPQVALADGRMVGVEALLRWHSGELGEVMPAEFIRVAEDGGLILPIGEWVLRTAVRQMKAWIDGGMAPMIMSVNLSAVQFRHANLPQLVEQILAEEGLAPEFLELELTESVAMDDPLAAIAVMDALHARGIRMSIDDFGTGYSSLSYLRRFQVYKLKIDQSFVCDITEDPEGRAIVQAIISLANSLGLRTIAEGVETEGQLEFLRQQGCQEVQGYYFSRPLAADDLAAYVRGGAWRRRLAAVTALSVAGC
jgi:diguanylate cyclase (GGDEF)-like protein/PAS domain S-box-containing protein